MEEKKDSGIPTTGGMIGGSYIRQSFCTRSHFRLSRQENGMTSIQSSHQLEQVTVEPGFDMHTCSCTDLCGYFFGLALRSSSRRSTTGEGGVGSGLRKMPGLAAATGAVSAGTFSRPDHLPVSGCGF